MSPTSFPSLISNPPFATQLFPLIICNRPCPLSNHLGLQSTFCSLRLIIHLIVAHLLPAVTGIPSCYQTLSVIGNYSAWCPLVSSVIGNLLLAAHLLALVRKKKNPSSLGLSTLRTLRSFLLSLSDQLPIREQQQESFKVFRK